MNKAIGNIAIAFLLSLLPLIAQASGMQDLKRFFNDVKSFTASFEQVVLDENKAVLDTSSGRFWIARPGRFRWEYLTPSGQVIVGAGSDVWIHDIELEQVVHRSAGEAITDTPAALLAGEGRLEANFELQDLGRQGRLDWVRLLPRKKDSGYLDIRVGFENGQLRRLEMIDTFDQTTRMHFMDARENVDIPAERFRFTPPPGIDVIEE